jgi:hypothetical protein
VQAVVTGAGRRWQLTEETPLAFLGSIVESVPQSQTAARGAWRVRQASPHDVSP